MAGSAGTSPSVPRTARGLARRVARTSSPDAATQTGSPLASDSGHAAARFFGIELHEVEPVHRSANGSARVPEAASQPRPSGDCDTPDRCGPPPRPRRSRRPRTRPRRAGARGPPPRRACRAPGSRSRVRGTARTTSAGASNSGPASPASLQRVEQVRDRLGAVAVRIEDDRRRMEDAIAPVVGLEQMRSARRAVDEAGRGRVVVVGDRRLRRL